MEGEEGRREPVARGEGGQASIDTGGVKTAHAGSVRRGWRPAPTRERHPVARRSRYHGPAVGWKANEDE